MTPSGASGRARQGHDPFGVRGLNLWPRHSGARSVRPRGRESDEHETEPLVEMSFGVVTRGRVGDRAVGSGMRRRTLRRHLQGDVDTGERLADWTSHLRRFGRRFESGGVEPVDVA